MAQAREGTRREIAHSSGTSEHSGPPSLIALFDGLPSQSSGSPVDRITAPAWLNTAPASLRCVSLFTPRSLPRVSPLSFAHHFTIRPSIAQCCRRHFSVRTRSSRLLPRSNSRPLSRAVPHRQPGVTETQNRRTSSIAALRLKAKEHQAVLDSGKPLS